MLQNQNMINIEGFARKVTKTIHLLFKRIPMNLF